MRVQRKSGRIENESTSRGLVLLVVMSLTVSLHADQLRTHKDRIGSFPMGTRGCPPPARTAYPIPREPPHRIATSTASSDAKVEERNDE